MFCLAFIIFSRKHAQQRHIR